MWSSWNEATKGMTEALEKAGDMITHTATKAAKSGRLSSELNEQQQPQQPQATIVQLPPKEGGGEEEEEEESDSIEGSTAAAATATAPSSTSNKRRIHPGSEVMGKSLQMAQMGWSSLVETTKRTVDATREVVHQEQLKIQSRLQQQLHPAFYKRDPSLPLDVPALRDAEVVYITDRLITMSHPAMASTVDGNITRERKLAAVGHLLHKRHAGRYMVWNLSEIEYEIHILEEQVLTFSFPGSPSPPLGLLLKLLLSMESWLKADSRNVAVVHCLTGKGRTSTVVAAFLAWMGQAGFHDIQAALLYIAQCKNLTLDELTIPSQRRYATYFKNMLDGVRPSQPPLVLKRIIMSQAPAYAKGPPRNDQKQEQTEESAKQLWGCAPYLQLFKGGKLLFTTAASLHYQQSPRDLPFVQIADGSVAFNIDQIVQGDILVRCRHLTIQKSRVSMFRAAFHTGYVPPNVMRLNKSQLDGACGDSRFPDDFFLDLIFESCNAEQASQHLDKDKKEPDDDDEVVVTSGGGGKTVTASAYDSMLHRDSRFWDVITTRRQEQVSQGKTEDPLWGPVVGRRRVFDQGGGKDDDGDKTSKTSKPQKSALETFSIGGEFDFVPESPEPKGKPITQEVPPKKDDLMEALMALDEDGMDGGEIVFEDPPKQPAPTIVSIPPTKEDDKKDDTAEEPPSKQTQQEESEKTQATAKEEVAVDKEKDTETGQEKESSVPAAETKAEETQEKKDSSTEDMDALLDMDDDMDALLGTTDDDLGDLDLDDFEDDPELEDLENFLSKK